MCFRSPKTVREEPRDITNAPTLLMRVTLGFHVAGQFSVNLGLRSRRVFLVVYSTCVPIMDVNKVLMLRESFSKRFTICLYGKDSDVNFILMR